MFRSHEHVQSVVIPATAVVHLHDKDWVFTPAGEGSFAASRCSLGPDVERRLATGHQRAEAE